MAGRLDHLCYSGYRYAFSLWWPLVGTGYYDFTGHVERFTARDTKGNVVLDLTRTPNANGSYFAIQDVSFAASNGQTVPALCWIKLWISDADSVLLATQTLTYSAEATPPVAPDVDPTVRTYKFANVVPNVTYPNPNVSVDDQVKLYLNDVLIYTSPNNNAGLYTTTFPAKYGDRLRVDALDLNGAISGIGTFGLQEITFSFHTQMMETEGVYLYPATPPGEVFYTKEFTIQIPIPTQPDYGRAPLLLLTGLLVFTQTLDQSVPELVNL